MGEPKINLFVKNVSYRFLLRNIISGMINIVTVVMSNDFSILVVTFFVYCNKWIVFNDFAGP